MSLWKEIESGQITHNDRQRIGQIRSDAAAGIETVDAKGNRGDPASERAVGQAAAEKLSPERGKRAGEPKARQAKS